MLCFNANVKKTPNMVCVNIGGQKKYVNSIWGGLNTSPKLIWEKAVPIPDRFLAINTNNEVYCSYDGITWEQISKINDIVTGVKKHLAYGNGRFICIFEKEDIPPIQSIDGIAWTAITDGRPSDGRERGITYSNEMGFFITVGTNGTSWKLMDGTNEWIKVQGLNINSTDIYTNPVAGNNTIVCACSAGRNGYYIKEFDEWTTGERYYPSNVVYGNGKFLSHKVSDVVINKSIDGKDWSFFGSLPSSFSKATSALLVYGNNKFICFGNNHETSYLEDNGGYNWIEGPKMTFPNDVCFGAGKFVVARGGTMNYSIDGINWTESFIHPKYNPFDTVAHSFVH